MKSPFTGGRVKEVSTTETIEFRKERYSVPVIYYVCEDTGEQFTTTEQDTVRFDDLYTQYRLRHGIPFPDELEEIRESHRLDCGQMSNLLGVGPNQYARYEAGDLPSECHVKILSALKDSKSHLRISKFEDSRPTY